MTGITSFDIFNLPETPTFILCNPNREELYSLGAISDRVYSPRFNTLSELSFRADETVNGQVMPYYDHLVHRKVVYVTDVGYFMITSVNEKGDGVTKYKEIGCESLEVEFANKKVSLFKGTFQLYNIVTPEDTLMYQVLQYMPGWSIAEVDAEVAVKYRTFDVSDTTLYSFLMSDVEEAYECVVLFDTVNKEVSVKTVENSTTATDIYMSYDNLIKSIDVEEAIDNLVTSLTVLGGGELSINRVNPLGDNNIYDFTYFKSTDWMEQTLVDAITAWEVVVDANQSTYADLVSDLLEAYIALNGGEGVDGLITERDAIQTDIDVNNVTRAAYIQSGTSLTAITATINDLEADLIIAQNDVDAQQIVINNIITNMETINDNISFESNFTEAQIIELQPFIVQSSYINDNIIQTDSMNSAEIQTQAQYLYDQAIEVLSKISEPRYTFSVDSVNFMMIKDFESFMEQAVLGAILNLEIKDGIVTYPVLLGYDLDYDDPTNFSMMFGNRLRLDDEAFQFSDLMDEAISAGTTTKVNSESWGTFESTYKDRVSVLLDDALDASVNGIVSSTDQDITISQSGLRGRQWVEADSAYDPEQIWLVNNMIAFTDDNWDTAKMAIGKFETPSGGETWGIVADYLVGRMIAGNSLEITNEDSTFTVDGSGATLTDASFTLNTTDGKSTITLDPNVGINISTDIGGTVTDKFYVDTSGNLVMEGNLELGSNYIRTDGTAKLGGLTITPTTATFNGDIYANKLVGEVDYSQLSNIPADKITSGTMSGTRISGGSIYGAALNEGTVSWSGGKIDTFNGWPRVIGYGGLTLQASYSGEVSIDGGSIYLGANTVVAGTLSMGIFPVATQYWVGEQGYITSSSLYGYATESWTNGRFYSSGENAYFGWMSSDYANVGRYYSSGVPGVSYWSGYVNYIIVRGGIVTAIS